MNGKGTQSSSSLVIVSRKMLIAVIAGTALFSFGLGYFLGYGGSTTPRIVKQVEADNKVALSEERTVLDSSGKPTIVPPAATPGIIPKELQPMAKRSDNIIPAAKEANGRSSRMSDEKKSEAPKEPAKKEIAGTEKKVFDVNNKSGVSRPAEVKGDAGKSGKRIVDNTKVKDRPKKVARRHLQKSRNGGSPFYTVQLGAFEDPEKATKLKHLLLKKGFKASISGYKSPEGESLSRVRIGHYTTKKEADELLAGLKSAGIDGLVICGKI
ncbi:MAG TPA: SPOR domain-containing protein [Dissulfurispiraceae bacterium]|nr:SPOR domain-containing protein [Dissulfurispiraceae bacterium]